MESGAQAEPDYAEPQRQVQRWLGRCMLSLQQSERLLKALLHDADVSAVHSGREGEGAAAFEVRRAFEKEKLASMTLGGLVSAFCGDVTVGGNAASDIQSRHDVPDNRLSISWNFKLALDESKLEAMQSSMREMVRLRNEWVHHLVDRFDLQNLNGCVRALEDLQAGFEKAERFRLELAGIAKALVNAKEHFAAFHSCAEGQKMLMTGKLPLEGSSILSALLSAVRESRQVDAGVVWLSDVLKTLAESHPQERPEDYGYVSWLQLIHESGAFSIVRRDSSGSRIPPRVQIHPTYSHS